MLNPARVEDACFRSRGDLLSRREPNGHWTGRLASSALSTATATSALALFRREATHESHQAVTGGDTERLERLIAAGLEYLASQQNDDGGWGDTDLSISNIATTMLVRAALHLAGAADGNEPLLSRAEAYIESCGGVAGLMRRYGKDKTFAVPILTNCALAGLADWRDVAPLPFELACLPQRLLGVARLPVVSYAIPALVAIGQARYHHRRPWNPVTRALRAAAKRKSLEVVERMQPQSGGFLEATPLTSFVAMSLAAIGHADHAIVRRGVSFLLDSVREDGSWPIDTNLATWTTTLALQALPENDSEMARDCLEWLLSCQHRELHPFTGASPGGWAWTDLSGGVPDGDDTSGALLALWKYRDHFDEADRRRVDEAARQGVAWLLDLQNRDGGWPTFCRGWGALPFDRSSTDISAHALRALFAWRDTIQSVVDLNGARNQNQRASTSLSVARIDRAMRRGFAYLSRAQQADGSWIPLWFGNQYRENEENPVYGTSRVLCAYRDLGRLDDRAAQRGLDWLVHNQNADGGWGAGAIDAGNIEEPHRDQSSVEETALATEALLSDPSEPKRNEAAEAGIAWLVGAVETDRHQSPSPIGFYFAKLWYYEDLYPLVFTVSTLKRYVERNVLRTRDSTVTTSADIR